MRSLACRPPPSRRRKGSKQGGGRAAEDTPKEMEAGSALGKIVKETKASRADPEKNGLEEAMDVVAVSLRSGTTAGQP
jgi:hypothetical protein